MPVDTGSPPPSSLAHLGGNKFCLFWFSVVELRPTFIIETEPESLSEKEEEVEVVPGPLNLESFRIYCMKFRVTNGSRPLKSRIFPLKKNSISCQS
ncbi:unnamed protein product [Camellia sinensis]